MFPINTVWSKASDIQSHLVHKNHNGLNPSANKNNLTRKSISGARGYLLEDGQGLVLKRCIPLEYAGFEQPRSAELTLFTLGGMAWAKTGWQEYIKHDYGQKHIHQCGSREGEQWEISGKQFGLNHKVSSMHRSMGLRTIKLLVILKVSWSKKSLDSMKPANKLR